MKNCRNCGDLPLEDFFPARADRFCKECIRQKDRDRFTDRKDYKAQYDRLKKYGLTEEDYQSMLDGQSNKCAICTVTLKAPHVDHCHAEGHVRGLLCNRCNLGLGYFSDSPHVLQQAINYLNN